MSYAPMRAMTRSSGSGQRQDFWRPGYDELLGNEGDDWVAGGEGDYQLIGDNGKPFGAPPRY